MSDNLKSDLISDNKFQRKKALEELKKQTQNDSEVSQKVFSEYQVHILKCFRDESEMCRELSIDIMLNIIKNLSLNDYYITYIFPVIVERIGTPELIEDSEELRLRLVEFMNEIIKIYSKTEYLVPFLNDIILVLMNSLIDKHPKVKQACCESIILTAEAFPKHFHMQCESLIKPLIKCFTHQHFKIRVISVKATGVVIMHGSYKALDETITSLAERLFDTIPQVRRAVIQVASQLLLEYRDRYSYFHRILPLILTGLFDEIPETQKYAEELWVKVGLQYQDENEKDLKNEIDFIENLPRNNKYPRPNLGCRTLVQRNVSKIVAALCREISTTWQDDVKVRCGQLLSALILHSEENFTQNLQDVFPAMFSVCRQNDDGSQSVIKAAELIGVFIPQKTWFKFVKEALESTVNVGHLRVFKAILKGCEKDNLNEVCYELSLLLSARHICHVRKTDYLHELIEICEIITTCDDFPNNELSIVCLSVLGLGGADDSVITAKELVKKCWIKAENSEEVCEAVLLSLMDCENWTTVSTDKCIFDALLTMAESVENLHIERLLEMLSRCLLDPEDAEAQLTTFITLSTAVLTWNQQPNEKLGDFYQSVSKIIILPNLVWKAGRSHEAIRTITLQVFHYILECSSWSWISIIADSLYPLLNSLLEDSSRHTRRLCCECLSLMPSPKCQETIIKLYEPLLTALDDKCDLVRSAAVAALKTCFSEKPEDFDIRIMESHLGFAVETMLVHLEDDDKVLQKGLLDTLKVVAALNSSTVVDKMTTKEDLFDSKEDFDSFLDEISQ